MPCTDRNHIHAWPKEGELIIQKCERLCAYCDGDAKNHLWKFPWFLRRHVRTVHTRAPGCDHPNVLVSETWNEVQNSPRKRGSRSKKESPTKKKQKSKLNSESNSKPNTPSRRRRATQNEESDIETPEENEVDSDETEVFDTVSMLNGVVPTAVMTDRSRTTPLIVSDPIRQNTANVQPESQGQSSATTTTHPSAFSDSADSDLPISRVPRLSGQSDAEALRRHEEMADYKKAYKRALQDLAKQGADVGLTQAEMLLITADEVERLSESSREDTRRIPRPILATDFLDAVPGAEPDEP